METFFYLVVGPTEIQKLTGSRTKCQAPEVDKFMTQAANLIIAGLGRLNPPISAERGDREYFDDEGDDESWALLRIVVPAEHFDDAVQFAYQHRPIAPDKRLTPRLPSGAAAIKLFVP